MADHATTTAATTTTSSSSSPPLLVYAGVATAALVLAYILLGKGKKKSKKNAGALQQHVYQNFPLIQRTDINHNTRMFRFALPTGQCLGLPTGQHISLMFTDTDNKPVMRSYTPVSSDDDVGYFDLVIKVYKEGKMTQHLEHMKIGDKIAVKGPKGEIEYKGAGDFSVKRVNKETRARSWVPTRVKKVGMIAGGTGITPMLQIIREITKHHPQDTTEVSLIFANVTVDDILLRDELDAVTEKYSNVKVYYTLDKPPAGWSQGAGFVTKEMIAAHLPAPGNDTLVLVCGPPPMVKFMEKNLVDLKYDENQYFTY